MNVDRSPLVLPPSGPVLHPGAGLAIPASDRLLAAAAALRTACRTDLPPAELRLAARAAGLAWVDTQLDGFVLALAESARGRGASGSIGRSSYSDAKTHRLYPRDQGIALAR